MFVNHLGFCSQPAASHLPLLGEQMLSGVVYLHDRAGSLFQELDRGG